MLLTKQKPKIDTQKIQKKESNHTTIENCQITKKEATKKKGTRGLQASQKII